MLNTDSKPTAALVWIAIAGIAASFVWSYFALPTPGHMLEALLASDAAAVASRNQTLIAGLIGLGGAALAYLLDGWRDRVERRAQVLRAERRDGAVLAREALEIATACETAARSLGARPASLAQSIAELQGATLVSNHLVLAASAGELARLGPGASAAARMLRAALARLAATAEAGGRDDAGAARAVAQRALETAFAARGAARIFAALAKGGAEAADRLRVMPLAADNDPGADASEAASHRLQPAA